MVSDHLFNMKFIVQRLFILPVIQNSNLLKETINKHFGSVLFTFCLCLMELHSLNRMSNGWILQALKILILMQIFLIKDL